MSKKILFSIVFLFCIQFSLLAQTEDQLIQEGITLHDQGEYNKAIIKYEEALVLNPQSVVAWGEIAYSQMSLQEYDKAVESCKKAISIDPNSTDLKFIYTTYGNTLDHAKKPEDAIAIYEEGIELFPDYYQLHFNKGITHSGLNELDEALLCFEKSISINPNHASSHQAIGRIQSWKKKKLPSVMAFSRFFVLEPQGKRAASNLPLFENVINLGITKTGKNSVSIGIESLDLSTDEEKEVKENDFSGVELILSLSTAMDFTDNNKKKKKKEKKKNAAEELSHKLTMAFGTYETYLEEGKGFYWEYYAPYFYAMHESKQIDTFCYLVYASSSDKEVQKWLKDNGAAIDLFYGWSNAYDWD